MKRFVWTVGAGLFLCMFAGSAGFGQTSDCMEKCTKEAGGDRAAALRCVRQCGPNTGEAAPARDRTGRGRFSSPPAQTAVQGETTAGRNGSTAAEPPQDFNQDKEDILDSLKK